MNGYPRFGWVDILRFQHSNGTASSRIYELIEPTCIDVDEFMSIPMDEITGHSLDDFVKASLKNGGAINLGSWIHPLKYKVSKANIDRYLWLATRMGKPTIKDGNAPGLERIPIYNITKL